MTKMNIETKGFCGYSVTHKLWNNGQSFKCTKREATMIIWGSPSTHPYSVKEICQYCRDGKI